MKEYIGVFFGALGCFLVIIGLTWVVQGNDFFMYQFFAPKYESARRNTFEQSKAYNDGMAQELRKMQFEYVKADEAHKAALRSIIIHRVDGYPEENLPSDLRSFVNDLKGSNHASY